MNHCSGTQSSENRLWKDFVKAIEEGDENQVRRILEGESSHNGSGGIHPFLTKKERKSQEVLTALHLAVKLGKEGIVKLLLKKGTNVRAVDQHHCTALHTAVKDQGGNAAIIQLLLNNRDVDINAVDEYGNTSLKLAAETGNIEAVKLLIDSKADISKADMVGNTAIHVAAAKGYFNVLRLLVLYIAQDPGLIGQQNKDLNTPLHLAVQKQCQKSVLILLSYGAFASLGTKNQYHETPKQLTEDKEIIKLLEDPSKAAQQFREWQTNTPPVQVIGRGSPVVADSPGNLSTVEPVTSSNLVFAPLPSFPGPMQYAVYQVNTQQFTIENNITAEVHGGGYAAIGPGGQVNLGGSAVTDSVRPQPVHTGESTYHINVSGGGNAAIGDHSTTNVNIGTPRPPSSASSSGSTDDPWFPERSENRSNRIEGGPRCPTEGASVGALPHPIQEDKSSGNRMENGSKTPGQLPHPVPEESKKGVASGTTGELSHPVPERARPGTPTENASDSDAVNVPHSVSEQSHPRNAELVTSRNSDISEKWSKETRHEFSSNCYGVATEAIEFKPGGTVDTSNTQALTTAVSVTNSSVERTTVSSTAPNESSPSAYGISTRGVGTVPVKGKLNDSPGNTRTNQATGVSGNQGQPKASAVGAPSHRVDIGWGQQLQEQGSKGEVALTRAAPKAINKRLLEMSCSSTSGHEPSDSPLGQMENFIPAFGISFKNGYLPRAQVECLETKSQDLGGQSATGNAMEKEDTSADSGVKPSRVGLSRSPGRSLLFSQPPAEDQKPHAGSNAGQCGNGLEHVGTSRLSGISKEAPHRKERFFRVASSPDGGSPAVESSLQLTGAAVAVEDQSANRPAGVNSTNRMEQQSASRGSMNTGTQETSVVINDESDDDSGGMKRFFGFHCTII